MWFGIVMSDEEIKEKHDRIYNRFLGDKRNKIPRMELSKAISEEFDIPSEVADAYITIALTYYSTDWYAVLDNIIRLMKTEMPRSVYETLGAIGKEKTVENAIALNNVNKKLYET